MYQTRYCNNKRDAFIEPHYYMGNAKREEVINAAQVCPKMNLHRRE